jgi:uncharacterized membrane protein YraQ (UPF0718 family)
MYLTHAPLGGLRVADVGQGQPMVTDFLTPVAGAGSGVTGALLIVLPAICLPSMVMVGKVLSWRVTAAMAGAVCLTGLLGRASLTVLGG